MKPCFRTGLALVAALAGTALVYGPGLSGGFWFDDYPNLRALGAYGGVHDLSTFWLYLTSGNADPTGRPLALLSFLLDARDWPADPAAFKRSNLVLHLINGMLLFALLRRWGVRAGLDAGHAGAAAVLAAALWLLHPLWVSTVTYVVQRQAMLPATFVLLALLAWEAAWRRLECAQPRRAWLWGLGGVGLASVCAPLSKANGALTPLLVALAWWLLYRPTADRLPTGARLTAQRLARGALLLPSALVLAVLVAMIPGSIESAQAYRPWTLAERMLSQPRALWDYLGLLWLPREGSRGIFTDEFPLSTGLLSPWTTLPAWLGLAVLIGATVRWRRSHPSWSLALGFFLVGHLMESGWLPLELYFEHRNYLPAMLLFWPLAIWLTAKEVDTLRPLRRALTGLLPLLLAGLTIGRASAWGDEATLAARFAARNPDSPRAQLWQSSRELDAAQFQLAVPRLLAGLQRNPEYTALAWNLLDAECRAGRAHPDFLTLAEQALRSAPQWQGIDRDWLSERIAVIGQSECPHYSPQSLGRLLDAAEANSRIIKNPDWHQDVIGLRAELALAQGDLEQAEGLFQRAVERQPRPDMALRIAALWGTHGEPARGLAHLDWYRQHHDFSMPHGAGMPALHHWLLRRDGYFEREMDILAATLGEDLAAMPHTAKPPEPATDDDFDAERPDTTDRRD